MKKPENEKGAKNPEDVIRGLEDGLYNAAYSYAETILKLGYPPRDIFSEEARDIVNAALGDACQGRPRNVRRGNYG